MAFGNAQHRHGMRIFDAGNLSNAKELICSAAVSHERAAQHPGALS